MTTTPPPPERIVNRNLLTVYRAEVANRLGARWATLDETADGASLIGPVAGVALQVIWSLAVEDDGEPWLHVSTTPHRGRRTATWEEMAEVKRLFVGPHRWAYEVHPPEAEHVNIHHRVLHLWAPFDAVPRLPDFTAGRGSI